MKLFLSSLCLVAFATGCTIVNWQDKASSLTNVVTMLNGILGDTSGIGGLIKQKLPTHIPGPVSFSTGSVNLAGYNYKFDIALNNLRIEGLDTIQLGQMTANGPRKLKVPFIFNKLKLKATAEVTMHQLTQTGCAANEEEYLGLCYKKCSILTNGEHPKRTATNTCSINGCRPSWELSGLICYPKCKPKYKGVGPVCWGKCSEFYGPDYKDTGLTCHRWWPPHSQSKPSYGRGVGEVWNKPWTKCIGCCGFGVSGTGGCATPYWRLCFTQNLSIQGEKNCRPKVIDADFDLEFTSPVASLTVDMESLKCPAGSGEMGVDDDIACVLGKGIQIAMSLADDSTYDQAINSFGQQFKSIKIDNFDLQFNGLPTSHVNLESTGLVGFVIKLFNTFVKPSLISEDGIKNKIMPKVSDAVKSAINQKIAQTFNGKFAKC